MRPLASLKLALLSKPLYVVVRNKLLAVMSLVIVFYTGGDALVPKTLVIAIVRAVSCSSNSRASKR